MNPLTNSFSPGAAFIGKQQKLNEYLKSRFAEGRKLELDKLGEPILWTKNAQDAVDIIKVFMLDPETKIDFLSDITAYDNKDKKDGTSRFILVHNLYSTTLHTRIRLKTAIQMDEEAVSMTHLFKGANWLEREVYDMFGIKFKNHPNMRRILMDERFSGHPLRKEYPIKLREPFADNIKLHLGATPLPPVAKE